MEHDFFNWVIPCSFSTQIFHRDRLEDPIEVKHIKVGSREDEKDGTRGDSATQRTLVCPITYTDGLATYTIRLIDTPGIGDTRGIEYDQRNMADVLLLEAMMNFMVSLFFKEQRFTADINFPILL